MQIFRILIKSTFNFKNLTGFNSMKISSSFPRVNGNVPHSEHPEIPFKEFSFKLDQFKNLTQAPLGSSRTSLDLSRPSGPSGFVEEIRDWLNWPMEFEVGGNEYYVERWKFLIVGAAFAGVGVFLFVR